MKIRLLILLFGSILTSVGHAGTAAVLTEDEQTKLFAKVVPDVPITFPVDHLAHPDFRIEWWYFTANVWDENGQHYGLQFTLFRQALAPSKRQTVSISPWDSRQSWMAHSAISFDTLHKYEERFARGGIGQAGVHINQQDKFEAWIDDWHWLGNEFDPSNGTLKFSVADMHIKLRLTADQEWIRHGNNGYSQKSEKHASYYYTHPNINVTGQITFENGNAQSLEGKGWLDREWSSQFLSKEQSGWDWFSVQLDDQSRLMLFQLRDADNNSLFKSGTWLDANGKETTLDDNEIMMTPLRYSKVAGRRVPTEWRLTLQSLNKSWIVKARNPNSWLDTLFPYWEGPIQIYDGTANDAIGVGFMEMTGY